MMKKLLLVGLALSALSFMQATPATADGRDNKTVLTFNQTASETESLDRALGAVPATVGFEQEGQTVPNSQASRTLTLIVLIGCVGICLGSLLSQFRKPVPVANR